MATVLGDSPKGPERHECVGWDEGRATGKAEGKAELLERLLTKKFGALPDAVRSQLMSASDDELNEWSEAVLIAKTLGEVFSDA